ncbi:MAG TPA: HAD family hydrolase [Ktedonobacteraceae bacterium]|jgi:putative hydrolase of the HAD superfamily|nr:HAD family hydrolase [Ktedonobacteraceae bacterium]
MRYHLLIDADDTLWENNIYFERAIHEFIEFLNHSRLTPDEVRAVIDEFERANGIGSANFTKSLEETYRHLAENEFHEEDLQHVHKFGEQIRVHPLELLDGVEETLEYLSGRHDLILLTKGNREEQLFKVEQSGVERFFREVVVAHEKNVATYEEIVRRLGLDANMTWMIGNSPRSDINPALAAGLRAVFVPHPHTWHMEHEEVTPVDDGRLLTLSRFAELRNYF